MYKNKYLKYKEKYLLLQNQFGGESGSITYDDGVYEGKYKVDITGKKIRDGKGIMKYKNDDVYEGFWNDDKKYACGVMKFTNGDIYDGEWENDIQNGPGKMVYVTKSDNPEDDKFPGVYEGMWKDNKRNGKGKFTSDNMYIDKYKQYYVIETFEGIWKDDIANGDGKLIIQENLEFSNKTHILIGNFVDDSIVGKIKIIFEAEDENGDNCGSIFEGNMNGDIRTGTLTYKSYLSNIERIGTVYTGMWDEKLFTGTGKIIYPSDSEYKEYNGEWSKKIVDDYKNFMWVNSYLNGKGNMVYTNGDVYDGTWKKSEKSGKGKMIYKNGDVYDGEWVENIKYGIGIMTYANGEVYEGDWKYNKRDGKGKMIKTDGSTYNNGKWEKDEFLLFSDYGIRGEKKYINNTISK